MPYEWRPLRRAAIRVLPVPTIGSRTTCPRLVKNSMNSCASDSGNLAGWRNTSLLRGGGVWINQDFWNFSQDFGSSSFKRLTNGRFGILVRNFFHDKVRKIDG